MSAQPIVNLADVPLRDFGNGRAFAARLGRVGHLIGARRLGCQLHIVPAGKKAYPRHAHHANEEMFLILSGEGTYRAGAESFSIRASDVIAAPAGAGETAHQIANTGKDELRYLAFSTRNDPDVVEYPDSGKFAVASMIPDDEGLLGARVRFIGHRNAQSLDYFDGEE
ncbi:MAG: cupin domain-containing protein [Methylocella sp.]